MYGPTPPSVLNSFCNYSSQSETWRHATEIRFTVQLRRRILLLAALLLTLLLTFLFFPNLPHSLAVRMNADDALLVPTSANHFKVISLPVPWL